VIKRARLVVVLAVVLAGCTSATISSQVTPTPLSPAQASGTPVAASLPETAPALPSPSVSPPVPIPSSMPTATLSPAVAVRLPGEPDRALTPGAANPAVTSATIHRTICVSGWTATVRPPTSYTNSLMRRQIAAYGYSDTSLADYEEDHLIPLELGGAPSNPANLWPEPYVVSLADGSPDGARVKDKLENKLKKLVCTGSLALRAAQHEIATDWVDAWFGAGAGTGTPAPTPAAKPTTRPAAPAPGGNLRVRITRLTSPVTHGSSATLDASTVPGADCRITVVYKSGPSSARGLDPHSADGAGDVSWTWTVGSRTTPGSWPVTVTCSGGGRSASASATLVVR
jgi:hypothetical protein